MPGGGAEMMRDSARWRNNLHRPVLSKAFTRVWPSLRDSRDVWSVSRHHLLIDAFRRRRRIEAQPKVMQARRR